ncbi:MAG: hemerythrin domain-containing protein [Bacteriovoracaceae bacterium]
MSQVKDGEHLDSIQDISVIDLILLDHRFLKLCISILKDHKTDQKTKVLTSKSFLKAIQAHTNAEKKAIYKPLENNQELHFHILEAQIEHGIIEQKIKKLRPRLSSVRKLSDEVEVEIKVLSEYLEKHLREEESEILPRMKEELDDVSLNQLGVHFMKLRKYTADDLRDYPKLENELIQWKDSVQKISSQYLRRMDKVVENLRH